MGATEAKLMPRRNYWHAAARLIAQAAIVFNIMPSVGWNFR
jgi:hypothetical protein